MPRFRFVLLLIVIVVLLALFIATFKHTWWWIEVHTGTVNESGPYYGFWSGFGSDLGEATIVGAVLSGYRHHNCHTDWCPWLGHKVDGTPYVACPKHHPAHKGKKRGVSAQHIHDAFHANQGKPVGQ